MLPKDHRIRHRVYIEVDAETLKVLLELSDLLKQTELLSFPKSVSHREYERMYRDWRREVPAYIERQANMIGVSRGIQAIEPFYRQTFARLYPDRLPTGKIGRPENYVPESRREKIRLGYIVSRLLSIGGDALRAELDSIEKAA